MAPDTQVNVHSEMIPVPGVTFGAGTQTMSSREIADLVEKRHDNVKRTIDSLAQAGLVHPQIEDEPEADALGRTRVTKVYRVGKRDSYVIVAQLSPEFTARLVDRWQELEAQVYDPRRMLNDPAALRALLADYANDKLELQARVADMETTVAAYDQIAEASGSLCVRDTAKHLGIGQKALFDWLRRNKWTYRRVGLAHDLAYQDKITSGLMEHKVSTQYLPDGDERIRTQARVTAKGLTRLAKLLQPTAQLVKAA